MGTFFSHKFRFKNEIPDSSYRTLCRKGEKSLTSHKSMTNKNFSKFFFFLKKLHFNMNELTYGIVAY